MEAVVVFSGGIDSVTLLHYVKNINYEIRGLSFDYGQKHKKELKFAEYWGRKLCKSWKAVKIDFMREIASNSALTGDKEVPHEHYTDETQKITVVPNRNMVMLSIAIALGGLVGISTREKIPFIAKCFKSIPKNVKLHAFGITTPRLLILFPWYSCDSTCWMDGMRRGELFIFDKGLIKDLKIGRKPTPKTDQWRDANDWNIIQWKKFADYLEVSK